MNAVRASFSHTSICIPKLVTKKYCPLLHVFFLNIFYSLILKQADGNMNGPNLFGIYEKKAGVVSGYSYTEANKKSGTLKSVAWYFEEGGVIL